MREAGKPGAIANLTSNAGVGHYWLRDPSCVPDKLRPNTYVRKFASGSRRFGKACSIHSRPGPGARPFTASFWIRHWRFCLGDRC